MSGKTIESVREKLFKVSVPVLATYTDEEIEYYGIPLNHNLETDKTNIRDVLNMTTVYLPITRLIDIYSNGYPILLLELDKIALFYNTLSDYIYILRNNVISGINHKRLLDNRLEMINNFAKEIYENNKRNIDLSAIKEFEGFGLGGLSLMGFNNVSQIGTTPSLGSVNSSGINYIAANTPEVDMDELKNKRYRRYGKGLNNVN